MKDPFEHFTTEALRIELLPWYRNPDGSNSAGFNAWKEGRPIPEEFNSDWVDLVTQSVSRGGAVRRLRLVSNPLSEYEKYEISAGYGAGSAAGEDIRIALRSELAGAVDAWFFDSQTIRLQLATEDGSFLGTTDGPLSNEQHELLNRARNLFLQSPTLEAYRARGDRRP